MFLPKRRASPFQQWSVSVKLKIVRLASFVCGRKAEAFFFFSWSLEASVQRILGQRIKNTGFGYGESIFPLCYSKILCGGNQDGSSSGDLMQTSALASKCYGYCESTRHPGRAHV